jgi:hypothetical protein
MALILLILFPLLASPAAAKEVSFCWCHKEPVAKYDPLLKFEDRKLLRERKIRDQSEAAIAFYYLRMISYGPADTSDDTED